MTPTRRRAAVAVTAAAIVGAMTGIGGTSLALWGTGAEVTGTLTSGYEYFAVGSPGATVPAPSGTATFVVGAAEATTLVEDKEVAVPIQVDSLSQGNKGLRYELELPKRWGDNVFGAADVRVFPVDEPRACHITKLSPETAPAASELASTPVQPTYSTASEPTPEYWCLYAAYEPPVSGTYENTATVTAEDPAGKQITATDSWNAVVLADLDPADEPEHTLAFRYTTFRPEVGQ